MFEILSHQYLKKFVNSHEIDWVHIYSFGRIMASSLKNKRNLLVNSEIFNIDEWWAGLLIPLFLYEKDSICIISAEKIKFLKKNKLPELTKLGFQFDFANNTIIFSNHQIHLLTFDQLILRYQKQVFQEKHIVFTEVDKIQEDLKKVFRISLYKKDWSVNRDSSMGSFDESINLYNLLKKNLFLRSVNNNNNLLFENSEINLLKCFFIKNFSMSEKFLKVKNALTSQWACWAHLVYKNFEWIFNVEPIAKFYEIRELLSKNFLICLSSLRKDNYINNYFNYHDIKIDLQINFKSNFDEKKILIYAPPRQLLPNHPFFQRSVIEKCSKLLFYQKGWTLILTNSNFIKKNIATELASLHGKRVLLESLPKENNQIICASFDWWINHAHRSILPAQIIIPIIPIPDMADPLNQLTVSYNKKKLKDWFRDFLLTEALITLERTVAPLRRNAGYLVILDGRISKRQWGKKILEFIEPSKAINYLFPFD